MFVKICSILLYLRILWILKTISHIGDILPIKSITILMLSVLASAKPLSIKNSSQFSAHIITKINISVQIELGNNIKEKIMARGSRKQKPNVIQQFRLNVIEIKF